MIFAMKSPLLRLTQNGKTIGVRADAILAVTIPTEGRTGSTLLLNTRASPSQLLVAEEPEAILNLMDEVLGFSRTAIKPPGQR